MHISKRQFLSGFASFGFFSSTSAVSATPTGILDLREPTIDDALKSFPFDVVTAEGASAIETWTELKAEGRGWPVVLGAAEDVMRLAEAFGPYGYSTRVAPATIITAASKLTLPRDLLNWWKDASGSEAGDTEMLGSWPEEVPPADDRISVAVDVLSGRPHEVIYIAILPTRNSWEAPAYLRWGRWNLCPPPEYHVAMLRRWHGQYGADVIGMSGDVLDLKVMRPVVDHSRAIALAREQYAYCSDLVDQGAGTLSNLAASLTEHGWWHFWWD